ncbi:MAG: hypothetical protein ACRCYU_14915 [Nocardioides sp.]
MGVTTDAGIVEAVTEYATMAWDAGDRLRTVRGVVAGFAPEAGEQLGKAVTAVQAAVDDLQRVVRAAEAHERGVR